MQRTSFSFYDGNDTKAEGEPSLNNHVHGIRYEVERRCLRKVGNNDNVEEILLDVMELAWINGTEELRKEA